MLFYVHKWNSPNEGLPGCSYTAARLLYMCLKIYLRLYAVYSADYMQYSAELATKAKLFMFHVDHCLLKRQVGRKLNCKLHS